MVRHLVIPIRDFGPMLSGRSQRRLTKMNEPEDEVLEAINSATNVPPAKSPSDDNHIIIAAAAAFALTWVNLGNAA
jgi:hypothetical protein